MYEQYLADPDVGERVWREFFADYHTPLHPDRRSPAPTCRATPRRRRHGAGSRIARRRASRRPRARREPAAAPAHARRAAPPRRDDAGEPIRGAGAAIATNMERSLTVPTATSFRNVPAKLLEVNRKVINGYRGRSGQGKVSFTHLIGYAIVRAIADAVPNMNNTFAEGADGKPRLVRNEHVNMGLAVDVDKADGSRTLVVPVLRDADTLDFAGSSPPTRTSSARCRATSSPSPTSRAPRSRSPTPARSAPSSACRG